MTLKHLIILTALIVTSLVMYAQQFENIEFIENKGQWDNRVKFKGNVSGGAFFIRSGGVTVLQHNPDDLSLVYEMLHHHGTKGSQKPEKELTLRSHAYNVDFVGASSSMQLLPDKPVPSYNNYFIGSDPAKWASNCSIYQAVTLQNVYPNVDVRYYTHNGTLKYDIIARPGADISKIALKYEGIEKLFVKNKELVVKTSIGDLRESSPYTYQANGKEKKEVSCRYIVKDDIVRFDVKNYDPTATLVIDPNLIFCSFSGSTSDNWGFTATYGPDGSMFAGGIVFDNGFPTSPGAYQTTYQGGEGDYPVDIGIIKLSPNGSSRVFATYIGGSGNEQPHSLIVDPQGNCILAGRTNSPGTGTVDYPVTGAPAGVIGKGGGYDIVVTKLNATGTELIGSKRIGGTGDDGVNISYARSGPISLQQNYGDDGRSEVNIDINGNIYIASCTQSGSSTSADRFPVSPGAFQQNFGGGLQDGVVLKFNANLSSLLFSTFLGGNGNDAAYVLSLAPNGSIYVGGGTESNNFPPSNQTGTISNTNSGGIDGYLAVFSNDGSSLIRSTYLGTTGTDQVYGVQFDRNGFPYVMGQTTGNWPHINTIFINTGAKQFIAKLQPDLSAYVYSTVFGTSSSVPNISPIAFLVDRCENVYVSGWGGLVIPSSLNYYPNAGTSGMPTTPDALKPVSVDNGDFYFFVLKKNGASQLYGSFFGQNGGSINDHVDGGTSRFDQNGVIYQSICANCGGGVTFPTTPGVWATVKPASANCNIAMVKIEFNLAGVDGQVNSSINGVPGSSSGCVPLRVDFTDTIHNAQNYIWNFGDGSPIVTSTTFSVSHTYIATGAFQVMLIAVDSATCNIRDTSYLTINVSNVQALLALNAVKLAPCNSFRYRFDNLSTPFAGNPFGPLSFRWDFGDGSPIITAGTNSVFHNYTNAGTYNVKLYLRDNRYCNSPDSLVVQVRVAALVKALFTTPPSGCVPYSALFTNTSLAGQSFQWLFGDGGTSTAVSPTHIYNLPGTYTVTLIANDSNTCNLTDTLRQTIIVYSNPVANFSYLPNPPVANAATTFTNLSSPDAVLFHWDFGDGDTLETTSRLPLLHQYNTTGTFSTCLIAYNIRGCPDTICRQVETLILPLVDVPNAFTPQSGDVNSIVLVRGFGISKMRFIIWNRWGQKIFETNDRFQGWDGKFKGTLQPMDVYAYTLDVEFFDGTKATKKGDITLIR